ncbi:MAG: DUF885 domain-containing protein [Gillisia sp.]
MFKKSILPFFTLILILLAFTGCKDDRNSTPENDEKRAAVARLDSLLDGYYEEGLVLNPIDATNLGDNRYNDQFPNVLSEEYRERLRNYYTTYRDEISKIDDAHLSETEKMSKDIILYESGIQLEGLKFNKEQYMPIDQMWSVNLYMGQLGSGASSQPFKTPQDYRNWLKRVDAYLEWFTSAQENMRRGIEEGYVLPRSLVVKVVPQMTAMTGPDVENHLFFGPITNIPEDFSAEDKEQLRAEYTKMITEKLIPAYRKMQDFLQNEYLPKARETSGIAELPDGPEFYKYQIKKNTTTNMTAEEIHQLGLDEVARISAEMEKVKAEVGYEGDLKSFFTYVRNNKVLMPFKTADEVIANFNKIHKTMEPHIGKLFDLKPKTQFEVRRTEAFRENSAAAQYNVGSRDGSRPGVFYVPIPDAANYNIYSDESLFLHEAIPGHHYQFSLTQENEELPEFRKILWHSGYGEGWALYTESLGKELGLYTDPYQYFGMLGMEMHRAIRLVVDTGLHSKGWTREQAITYSLENEADSEAKVTSEIERYMANPGQALSYKIGQLKIRELRDRAESQLGDKFDVRQFHNQVLEAGSVPLQLLEEKIDRWIAGVN